VKRANLLAAALPLIVAAAPAKDWKRQTLASAAPFIDRANDEWTRAIVTGDADALTAPYADRGVFVGPDGSTVSGRDAVRAMYAKRRSDVRILKAIIKSEGRVAPDSNDVYEWGSATMTVERNGATRSATGRYLTVWHRDGKRWSITRNIAF
jgi:ketosteroid isomerase-like protein